MDVLALVLVLMLLGGGSSDARPEPPDPEPDPPEPPGPLPEPDPLPKPPPRPDDAFQPVPGSEPLWVLPGNKNPVRASSFGQGRPYASENPTTHHTGVDIRARAGDPVVMPEDGTVVRNQGWSGDHAKATIVQLWSGPVLVFGAVDPDHLPKPGTPLRRGELVGRIGVYPKGSQMLHFEQWKVGSFKDAPRPPGPWKWDAPRPAALVNPYEYLSAMVR